MSNFKSSNLSLFVFSVLSVQCCTKRDNLYDETFIDGKENFEEIQLTNDSIEMNETAEEGKPSEVPYEYSDFVGYYLHFDSDDRTHADMIATIGNKFITIGEYRSTLELYRVVEASVEENILSVNYAMEPYEGEEDEMYGMFQIFLYEENREKYIKFESEMIFYEVSYEEVLSYDYIIKDFLFEDINQ